MLRNLDGQALGITSLSSDVIEALLSNHFRQITLDLASFEQQVAEQGLAKARRLIDSARLKIGFARLPLELGAADADFAVQTAKLPAWAQLLKEMGCNRATVEIEPGSDLRPYHENFELHRRRLKEVASALAGKQIRLGVGFSAPAAVNRDYGYLFIQAFDQLLLLLKMTGEANLGIALDLWQWHLGGGKLEALQALTVQEIVTVALSDCSKEVTPATATPQSRLLPGETGVIDAAAVVKLLAEKKFDGPITPLAAIEALPTLSRDRQIQAVGAALDRVWSAAGLPLPGKRSTAMSGK